MTPRRPSCVLLVADDPKIFLRAEARVGDLFDALWISRHARSDSVVPSALRAIMRSQRPDYLFSLLSPVIVPPELLDNAAVACINFHPAPPEYPGVGACSYALYDDATSFGVTAHLMSARVDSGAILAVKRFPVRGDDRCNELSARAREACVDLFMELLPQLAESGLPVQSTERWAKPAVTTSEFLEWMTLDPGCDSQELERIVRAVRHPDLPGPYMAVHEHLFVYAGPRVTRVGADHADDTSHR
jgi:methionyl-tRNA formyltransferase